MWYTGNSAPPSLNLLIRRSSPRNALLTIRLALISQFVRIARTDAPVGPTRAIVKKNPNIIIGWKKIVSSHVGCAKVSPLHDQRLNKNCPLLPIHSPLRSGKDGGGNLKGSKWNFLENLHTKSEQRWKKNPATSSSSNKNNSNNGGNDQKSY